MALGDHTWYNNGLKNFLAGNIDWVSDTIKVALLTASYTPDYDNDEYFDDVSSNEVSDASYTSGGQTVTSKTVSVDTADDAGRTDGADTVFSSLASVTVGYAVIYKDTGTPSTSPLISVIDMASTAADGGDFTLAWDTDGILSLEAA